MTSHPPKYSFYLLKWRFWPTNTPYTPKTHQKPHTQNTKTKNQKSTTHSKQTITPHNYHQNTPHKPIIVITFAKIFILTLKMKILAAPQHPPHHIYKQYSKRPPPINHSHSFLNQIFSTQSTKKNNQTKLQTIANLSNLSTTSTKTIHNR